MQLNNGNLFRYGYNKVNEKFILEGIRKDILNVLYEMLISLISAFNI